MKTPIALEIVDLHKAYGRNQVLAGASLTVHEGELVGIFGYSGSGKSVLLRSIVGLERPDRGKILFESRDLTRLKESEFTSVREKIGYVFQAGALFSSMTIEENLAYPLRYCTNMRGSEIHALINQRLESVGLSGVNDLYPEEISGGMTKRVGLLRAMMTRPKITLFDEPTSGLDTMNVRVFTKAVRELRNSLQLTGIFVTHDIPCAFAVCDRIAILYAGRIHVVDTVENIQRSTDPVVLSFTDRDYTKPDPLELAKGGADARNASP